MKILLINKFLYIKGGSETYFFSLKKMLEENGHEVAVFSMKDKKNEKSSYEKYFVDNVNYQQQSLIKKFKNSVNVIWSREAYTKLSKLIEEFRPDIAHVNLIYHQLTPSIFHALKKYNIPIVLTSHDYKIVCPNYKLLTNNELCSRCIHGNFMHCLWNKCHKNSISFSFLLTIEAFYHRYKRSYDLADYIICPSRFMLKKLKEAGLKSEKLVHIPNFITNNFIDRKFSLIDKNKRDNSLLYYGRLSKEKGLDILLDAKKQIDKDFTLKIVGTGPEEERLKQRVINEKIEGVKFLGFKSGEDLVEEIRLSKATILPAQWHEVFGLTIIESYALGTPVIGSNLGGIPEIIQHGRTGFIFQHDNLNDLKKVILKMLEIEENKYNEMVNNCLRVKYEYEPQQYYNKIVNLYSKLLDNR